MAAAGPVAAVAASWLSARNGLVTLIEGIKTYQNTHTTFNWNSYPQELIFLWGAMADGLPRVPFSEPSWES